MEEWKEYRLGDILNFRRGHDLPKSAMKEGEIPVAGSNGIIGYHNEATPVFPCITIGRSGNVGTPYIYDKCWAHNTVLYVDDFKGNNPLYLFYLLKTLPLSSFGGGSAVPTLNRNHIHPLVVKHTSNLRIQQHIASILKSIDDKIECNQRINDNLPYLLLWMTLVVLWLLKLKNDNLRSQAYALFKSWFVDFEPFKEGEFVESELGMIPKGWSVEQLGDVTRQQSERVKTRTDVRVLSPITTGELMLSEEYFTKQVFSDSISKYIVVKPRDFAYNPARVNIGSLGMNEFDFDGCVSPVYVVFRCEEGYQFFFDLFRHTEVFKEEVKSRAIGGVRQTLGFKDLSLIKVVYPPVEVVQVFNQIYSRILSQIKHNKAEMANLASIRDSLLPKLMFGELKISELTM